MQNVKLGYTDTYKKMKVKHHMKIVICPNDKCKLLIMLVKVDSLE